MNLDYRLTDTQYKKAPLTKSQGRLVDMNDFNNNQKRFYILPRYFPKPNEKDKQIKWKVSMEVAASTYISQDLNVSTLLNDSRDILSLNYTPDCIVRNDTNEKVTDLKTIPSGTFLYVKRDVEPQFKSKRLRLFRNSELRKDGKLYHTKKGGIDQLLKDSKTLLKFQPNENPTKLYLSNGNELRDLDSLNDDITTDVIVCLEQDEFIKSLNDDSIFNQNEIKTENPLMEQSDNIHNYILGMSNISIEKAKNYAKCAAFQMLTEKERRIHPEAQKIRQIMKGTHQQGFNQQMASQMIIPPISDEFITNAIVRKSIDILDDNELGKVRYVISGASGSGKTTFLYYFANTLVRKLRICDEEFNFLLFPINFEKYRIFKDDPLQLYNLFIETGFESANYTRFEFIQYSSILKQYLLQLPIQMNTKKPPINFKPFEGFSNEVVKCFQDGGKNIANVLQKFPSLLAEAINVQNAILIIDHFDEFGSEFCSSFMKAFSKTSFIISTKTDKLFYQVFQKTNAVFLYTENLLNPKDERILSVPELKLQLTAQNCFGSPGFLSSFTEICDLVENYNSHIETDQSIRGKFHNIRSKSELSRKFYIRQKLFNLCIALESAGSKVIKSTTLNGLGDTSDSNFSFQLTGTLDMDKLMKASSDSEEEDESYNNTYSPRNSFRNSPDNSPDNLRNSRNSPNNSLTNLRNSKNSPNNSPNNTRNSRNSSPNSFRNSGNNSPDNFNNSKNSNSARQRNNSPDNFNDNKSSNSARLRTNRTYSPDHKDGDRNKNSNKSNGSRNNSPDNFSNSRNNSNKFRNSLNNSPNNLNDSRSNKSNNRNRLNDFNFTDEYDNENNEGYEPNDYDDEEFDDHNRGNKQLSRAIDINKNSTRSRGTRQTYNNSPNSTLNSKSGLNKQQNQRISDLSNNANPNVKFGSISNQDKPKSDNFNKSNTLNRTSQKQEPSGNSLIKKRKSDFDSTSDEDY